MNLGANMSFHLNHGKRIELKNNGKTAQRNINEFNHGIVLSKHPLIDNVKFEVKIDQKIHSWSGSIEIGVSFNFSYCWKNRFFNGSLKGFIKVAITREIYELDLV